MTILITGGAGFIGSNFIHRWLSKNEEKIVNVDLLTYAGNINSLKDISNDKRYIFEKVDIAEKSKIYKLINKYEPRAVINFAAESHVDRSIHSPEAFIRTNINGVFSLLEASKDYFFRLNSNKKNSFKIIQVSTDEVYGSLKEEEDKFTEQNQYLPNSPYAASKAAGDHLARSYCKTYGLPVCITNCSNNYGPYQFPEKLIPLTIHNALENKQIPIYGDGRQIRDWLFVDDHCDAICEVLAKGTVGETYNIGGDNEITNIDIVNIICAKLDELSPMKDNKYDSLISYVKDRPGHDRRYAINSTKIKNELNWKPHIKFIEGIDITIQWYLDNQAWVKNITSGDYKEWIDLNYK